MSRQVRENFFSESNEQSLDRLLYKDIQRRTGLELNEKQKMRLVKTVKHYMGEVYRVKGNQGTETLNEEVKKEVLSDYMGYLRRQTEQTTSVKSEVEIINSEDPLRSDVGTRFALMQEARQDTKAKPPAPPDFRIPIEEDNASSISLYEQAKKLREAEALRDARAIEEYRLGKSGQMRPIEAAAVIRETVVNENIPSRNLETPDLRTLLFGSTPLNRTINTLPQPVPTYNQRDSGLAEANMTLAVPQVKGTKPVLPQDVIQREDDVLNYKENEFNLFCYSADRNWVVNTGENRYNFSVTFNAGNPVGQTFRNQTTTQMKFKNITRIELVKCIIPVEGVEVMIDASGAATANKSGLNTNALSFPYLMVYSPELDTNNAGTNYNLDNAIGVIQYDANWISDNNYTPQRGGYLAMIPKFMKCQKVYYPTPLSTLQKLTIRIQRPDGSVLSSIPDSLVVNGFILSEYISGARIGGGPNYYTSTGSAGNSKYIWIRTSTWFSRFMFNIGDRVLLQNVTFDPSINTAANGNAPSDFLNFIQNPQGLLIVNIGYNVGSVWNAGPNSVGYANYIIVDARYNDPTSGLTTISPFGGNTTVAGAFDTAVSNVNSIVPSGGVLNLSHQTQVVFRIITRDMDASSRLRPDNLN